jgi:hypothetical protein
MFKKLLLNAGQNSKHIYIYLYSRFQKVKPVKTNRNTEIFQLVFGTTLFTVLPTMHCIIQKTNPSYIKYTSRQDVSYSLSHAFIRRIVSLNLILKKSEFSPPYFELSLSAVIQKTFS